MLMFAALMLVAQDLPCQQVFYEETRNDNECFATGPTPTQPVRPNDPNPSSTAQRNSAPSYRDNEITVEPTTPSEE